MKSSTIPAIRIEPELREQLERVQQTGENLSRFAARGLASLESAKRDGRFVSAQEVIGGLEKKLADARARANS